ncbi:hypothetical protein MAUB1S_05064 [Mycolicibacterium aubagnense]
MSASGMNHVTRSSCLRASCLVAARRRRAVGDRARWGARWQLAFAVGRPRRPVRAARNGCRPRRTARVIRRMGRGGGHRAVPGAGGSADRAGQWRQRGAGDANGFRQITGRDGRGVLRLAGADARSNRESSRRTYYTAPIKALVSEKFFALCDVFGAANVGMLTGNAAVNAGADHRLHGGDPRQHRAA